MPGDDGRSEVRAVFVEVQVDADSGEKCVEHLVKRIKENRKETREREEKNERALVELAEIDPEWAAWERSAYTKKVSEASWVEAMENALEPEDTQWLDEHGQSLAELLKSAAREMQQMGMCPDDVAGNFADIRTEAKEDGFSLRTGRAGEKEEESPGVEVCVNEREKKTRKKKKKQKRQKRKNVEENEARESDGQSGEEARGEEEREIEEEREKGKGERPEREEEFDVEERVESDSGVEERECGVSGTLGLPLEERGEAVEIKVHENVEESPGSECGVSGTLDSPLEEKGGAECTAKKVEIGEEGQSDREKRKTEEKEREESECCGLASVVRGVLAASLEEEAGVMSSKMERETEEERESEDREKERERESEGKSDTDTQTGNDTGADLREHVASEERVQGEARTETSAVSQQSAQSTDAVLRVTVGEDSNVSAGDMSASASDRAESASAESERVQGDARAELAQDTDKAECSRAERECAEGENTDTAECSRAELQAATESESESERESKGQGPTMYQWQVERAKANRLQVQVQRHWAQLKMQKTHLEQQTFQLQRQQVQLKKQKEQIEAQAFQMQELTARMVQLEEQMQRGRECFDDTESDKGSAQAEVQRTKTQDGLGTERKLVPDVRTRQIPASSGEQISPQQTVRKAERPRAREVKRRKLGEAVQPRARGKEHVVQSRRTNTSPGDAAMAAAGESGAWRKQGQPRRPSSQGGGATGWNERHVRAAKMAKEQHVRAAKMAKARAAQRAAAARRAAERAWLARERAQGRDQKAAYARWEERRKVWLRREARKAARKRKNPRDCNVRMQGAAVAEEQTAAMKDTVAGGDLTASAADEQTAAVEDTKPGGVSFANASEPTAKTEAEGVGI